MVHEIARTIKDKKMTHAQAARIAWAHLADPATAWRGIRNGKKGQKLPRLTCADALAMCDAIGISFHELYADAKRQIKEGWDYRKHDAIDMHGEPTS